MLNNNESNNTENKTSLNENSDEIKTDAVNNNTNETNTDNNENKSSITENFYDWIQSAVTALVIVSIALTFCFRLVDVKGSSMENTLFENDKLIISNLFYTPKVNDIVIISHAEYYNEPIVKRVIATEGQTVNIDFEKGIVYVDGTEIDEPYIKDPTTRKGDVDFPITVAPGHVFVMGDNRLVSNDSRYKEIGQIEVSNIIGKAQFILMPFSRFRYLY